MCAAIGAPMWVAAATGAWPTTTGAWPMTAGAVKIGAGAKSGACAAKSGACGAAKSGAPYGPAGAKSGAAGAKRPACALATAAKTVKATKYDCFVYIQLIIHGVNLLTSGFWQFECACVCVYFVHLLLEY